MITQAKLLHRPRIDGRGGTRAAALALCLVASAAQAGNISITMTTTAEVREGALVVHLTVKNSGDEAASSVVPILRFGDREVRGTRQETLAPSQSIYETLTLSQVTLGPGRWPFRVAVDYTDQNQYPFQALHVAMITVGNPSPAKVSVQEIAIPPLSSSTVAHTRLKSLEGVSRKVALNVFAPEGLEVSDGRTEIDLAAWAEKDVSSHLINRTALAGSRYPIFVSVEYDDEGTHHAVISHGLVEVGAQHREVSSMLLVVVGVLIAAWLVSLGWRWVRAG